jgi:hypothetical protein
MTGSRAESVHSPNLILRSSRPRYLASLHIPDKIMPEDKRLTMTFVYLL